MKVRVLLPDQLVRSLRKLTGAATFTESVIIALTEWMQIQEGRRLKEKLAKKPLRFKPYFSEALVRKLNRRR